MRLEAFLRIDFNGDCGQAMAEAYAWGLLQARNEKFIDFRRICLALRERGHSLMETQVILEEVIAGFVQGFSHR